MILGSVSLEASDSVAGAYVFLEQTFWIALRGRWTDVDSAIGRLYTYVGFPCFKMQFKLMF